MQNEPEYPPRDPEFPPKPEHGATTKIMEFRCLKCGHWNRAPLFFQQETGFDTATMEGCRAGCARCGEMVPFGKENMRVRFDDGAGGFQGNLTA